LTPALLAANRRNALKSTGPRTPQGKAQVRLSRLQTGTRSSLYGRAIQASVTAPLGAAEQSVRALLTREQAAHPLFASLLKYAREEDRDVAEIEKWGLSHGKKSLFDVHSRNVIENTGEIWGQPDMLNKTKVDSQNRNPGRPARRIADSSKP